MATEPLTTHVVDACAAVASHAKIRTSASPDPVPVDMPLPCQETTCELHDAGRSTTHCQDWDGTTFDLVLLVKDRPTSCPFTRLVLLPIICRIVERSRGSWTSAEVLSSVALRVLETTTGQRSAALPSSVAALRMFVEHVWLDDVRHDLRRMRCTSCAHYQPGESAGGRCGLRFTKLGEAHAHYGRPLDVRAEPRRLVPPCEEFADARRIHYLAPDQLAQVREKEPVDKATEHLVDRLRSALAKLTTETPRLGAIVAAAKLEGMTYKELADIHGMTVEHVKRSLQKGMLRVREILGEPHCEER